MKLSGLERGTILAATAFLAFALGWFLRGETAAQPLTVEAERTLEVTETFFPAPEETGPAKVNPNTAGLEELMTLPGIGEKRAAAILADRAEHGPFRWPEDLTRVKGIGEATLNGLLDYITMEDTP